MIKIGLSGFYGFGEYCDDYIEMAIKNTFNHLSSDLSRDCFANMYFKVTENHNEIDKKVQDRIDSIRKQLCNMAEKIIAEVTK